MQIFYFGHFGRLLQRKSICAGPFCLPFGLTFRPAAVWVSRFSRIPSQLLGQVVNRIHREGNVLTVLGAPESKAYNCISHGTERQ